MLDMLWTFAHVSDSISPTKSPTRVSEHTRDANPVVIPKSHGTVNARALTTCIAPTRTLPHHNPTGPKVYYQMGRIHHYAPTDTRVCQGNPRLRTSDKSGCWLSWPNVVVLLWQSTTPIYLLSLSEHICQRIGVFCDDFRSRFFRIVSSN